MSHAVGVQSDVATDRMYRFLSILAALGSCHILFKGSASPLSQPTSCWWGTSQVQETSSLIAVQGAQVQFCFLPSSFFFFLSFFVLPSSWRLSCSSEAGSLLPTFGR